MNTPHHHELTQHAKDLINDEQFEDMRDLLEEDFTDLIDVYIKDSQQRIDALRVAQQHSDHAAGYETAHALKGASANLGATQLVCLSNQLQERCRERLIDEQATLIEDIAVSLQQTIHAINLRLER